MVIVSYYFVNVFTYPETGNYIPVPIFKRYRVHSLVDGISLSRFSKQVPLEGARIAYADVSSLKYVCQMET